MTKRGLDRLVLPLLAVALSVARAEETSTDPPGALLTEFTPRADGISGNFDYVGAARFLGEEEGVEISANEENSVGAIWSKEVNHADGWELQFLLHTTGETDSPGAAALQEAGSGACAAGKGLAFWYTNQPLEIGTLYGSEERFEGFGLLFDSHDDDGKVFNHDTDGLGTRFGGCRAKYRNRGNKVGVKISYQQDSIKVLLDMRNNGVWERCLAKDSIYLSTGSHIGWSAANMVDKVGDQVRISDIKFYDLETDKAIAAQEAEIAKQEEEERKSRTESGEIHNLAEQITGMQKNLHDEFLQKIAEMIQRDHVTSSHEFRSIRFQLSSMLEKSNSPKESLDELHASITQLKELFQGVTTELEALKEARGNSEDIKSLTRNIASIKNTVDSHASTQGGIKDTIKEHIQNVDKIADSAGGGGTSWTVLILFQVMFVIALVLWKRQSSGSSEKSHMI